MLDTVLSKSERETLKAPHFGWRRYTAMLTTSHVWLLAPTWIAVNASIGLWFSQSVFQFAKADPRFPDQALMRGFTPVEIRARAFALSSAEAVSETGHGAGRWTCH